MSDLFQLQKGVVQAAQVVVDNSAAAKFLMKVGDGNLRHGRAAEKRDGVLGSPPSRVHVRVDVFDDTQRPRQASHARSLVSTDRF